jgi:hypothetical protein
VWAAVRWLLALSAMALVAFFSGTLAVDQLRGAVVLGDGADADEVQDEPTATITTAAGGPVEDGSAPASADFSASGGIVDEVGATSLTVGAEPGDLVYVQFPLIPGDLTCLATVSLELEVELATPTELGVYPSGVFNAETVTDGATLPEPTVLADAPRAIAFTDGSPGRLRWDVTELYRAWASGESFTPTGAGVLDGTPFVVAVQPTVADDPDRQVRLAASEAGAAGPSLTWTGVPGCGTPTATVES